MKRTTIFKRLKKLSFPEVCGLILALLCAVLASRFVTLSLYGMWEKDTDYNLLQERAESVAGDADKLLGSAKSITISSNRIHVNFDKGKTSVQAIYDRNLHLLDVHKNYISPLFFAGLVGLFFFMISTPIFIIAWILLVYLVISIGDYFVTKVKMVLIKWVSHVSFHCRKKSDPKWAALFQLKNLLLIKLKECTKMHSLYLLFFCWFCFWSFISF